MKGLAFLSWEYKETLDLEVNISGADFIKSQPIVANDMKMLIGDWQTKCNRMYCTIDLKDANLRALNVKQACRLIRDLEDFTKDAGILQSINFINGGRLLKAIYWGARFAIPKATRQLIRFS
jgi:ABC-type antimicrobial peptide transport system ATPase subunit